MADIQACKFVDQCNSGDIRSFETDLWELVLGLYNQTAECVLAKSARQAEEAMRAKALRLGLGKLESRPIKVQIRTGHYVKVQGLYARQVPQGYQGKRQLLSAHWKLLRGASPSYYSTVCLFSVVSPPLRWRATYCPFKVLRIIGIAYKSCATP